MFSFQPPLTPGSNSTNVTSGLNIAGMVIFSFGVGPPFIISVMIASLFCIFVWDPCEVHLKPCQKFLKPCDNFMNYVAKKVKERPRQKG